MDEAYLDSESDSNFEPEFSDFDHDSTSFATDIHSSSPISSRQRTRKQTPVFSGARPPSLSVQLRDTQLENIQLRWELADTKAQLDAANIHALFAQREASMYAFQLNSKQEKDSISRRVHTRARILTSEEGRREAAEEGARQREKKRLANEKERMRKEKETAAIFSGSLSSKNKDQLGDISASLALPIDGTKDDIKTRITQHFEEHPEKKTDARYIGLFQPRGRKRAASVDENNSVSETPARPQQRRRLEPVTNHHQAVPPAFPPLYMSQLYMPPHSIHHLPPPPYTSQLYMPPHSIHYPSSSLQYNPTNSYSYPSSSHYQYPYQPVASSSSTVLF